MKDEDSGLLKNKDTLNFRAKEILQGISDRLRQAYNLDPDKELDSTDGQDK